MQLDMVFEGGGAKGMVFVGALRVLESAGHTPGRLVGTSAGAITATLLAAGLNANQMEAAMMERMPDGQPRFATFLDHPTETNFSDAEIDASALRRLLGEIDIPLVPESMEDWADDKLIRALLHGKVFPSLFSLVERGGIYLGEAFRLWVQGKLEASGFDPDIDLDAFFQATGKDLSLCATDTGNRQLLVLNHRTAPNCPVAWACRMSMSIPFAWQEVLWRNTWDPYKVADPQGAEQQHLVGQTIVDGGVLSNFPIDLLTSSDDSVRMVMGDAASDEQRILGLLIDEQLDVPNAPPAPEDQADDEAGLRGELSKLRTVQRIRRLANTMQTAHDNSVISAHEAQICRLPAKTYGTMEFDMNDARKEALVAGGGSAMRTHLQQRGLT